MALAGLNHSTIQDNLALVTEFNGDEFGLWP